MQIGILWQRLLLLAFYAGFSNHFVFGQSPLPPFTAQQQPGGTAASVSFGQQFGEAARGGPTPGGSPPTSVAGQQSTLTNGYGAGIGQAATSRSGVQADVDLVAGQDDKLVDRVDQLETAVARLEAVNRTLTHHVVQLEKAVTRLHADNRFLENDNLALKASVRDLKTMMMLDR